MQARRGPAERRLAALGDDDELDALADDVGGDRSRGRPGQSSSWSSALIFTMSASGNSTASRARQTSMSGSTVGRTLGSTEMKRSRFAAGERRQRVGDRRRGQRVGAEVQAR